MKRRKWNKVAAGALVTVLALANSITVFAYREPFQREFEEGASQEEIEYALANDAFEFVSDGICEEEMSEFGLAEETEIRYEYQFTDEEGNIYPITEPIQRGCSHTYVSGTAREHHPYSNGSCDVVEYRAKRCSKCGYVVTGEKINTITYAVCPH